MEKLKEDESKRGFSESPVIIIIIATTIITITTNPIERVENINQRKRR